MIMKIVLSFAISLAISVLAAFVLIPMLRRLKIGQSIKRNGPVWHMSKEGTPTMGGLIFILGITTAVIILGYGNMINGEYAHLAILALALIYGAIGFLDDFEKVRKKGNTGLTSIQKFLLQLVVAIAFVLLLRYFGYLSPNLYIPFINVTLIIYEPLYFAFASFVIVATVNAFNITDGVDGLLSGVSIPMALFFILTAYMWGMEIQGIFAAALLGGIVGFLIFNFNPARVFMGDTGSLFLGAAVCGLAFAFDMPLILVLIGIVCLIETLSDIIQVAYFKATHGKRFFKMAPIHHHFEKSGWSEKKLFTVFTTLSLIFAIIAWFGISGRYGM